MLVRDCRPEALFPSLGHRWERWCLEPVLALEMDLDKVLVAKLLLALSSPPPIRVIIDVGEFLHF